MEIIKLVELKEKKKKHEERWTEPNGPVRNHEADQPRPLSNFQKKTEKEKWVFEEAVAENFPNLIKDMNMNIQEAEQAPNKMYSREIIIIKLDLSTKRGSWKHQVKSGLSHTNHTSISRIHKEV